MLREGASQIAATAEAHFRSGVEVVYLYPTEDGGVRLSTEPPDSRIFVAARSIDQVRRYLAEHQRRSA
jgi:hypothetical protein